MYVLSFSIVLCGLILFRDFLNIFFSLVKNLHSNHLCLIFDFQLYLYNFFKFFDAL
jgi:hypothetical protein